MAMPQSARPSLTVPMRVAAPVARFTRCRLVRPRWRRAAKAVLSVSAMSSADTDNTALAALRQHGRTRLHLVNLATGQATLIGTVGDGRPLWGIAIAP